MALSARKRGTFKWLSLLTAVAGIGFGAYELFHWFTHVYEFDARIRTDLTRISSRVNGTIEQIAVKEGERVRAGDLLISMEADIVRQRLAALDADLMGASVRRDKLRAEKLALEADIAARAATKRQLVHALKVERRALVDRHAIATKKLQRTEFLVKKNLTSQKLLEDDQDRVIDLSGQIAIADAGVKVAEREVAEIEARRSEIAVLDQDIRIAEIEAARLRAQVREQEVNLSERFIKSPIDGVVDRVFKNQGEYVEDADELLIIHDPENIWIEANIAEDQIRHLQVGQPVKVDMDAYPFDTFRGRVLSIGMVTVADLAPGGNGASAKLLKATQRIPVKIKLLDPPDITAPGMLVEVNIQIRNKASLP